MISIMVPGPLSTIQDAGLTGYQDSGFQETGAADRDSMRRANLLAGNPQGEAVIEMTLMGVTCYFLAGCVIAVTGADISPEINWESVPMNTAIEVKKGDTFSASYALGGCRAYMAVAGGFDIPLVMGSRSTNLKLKSGGFEGRKLMAGDIINFRKKFSSLPKMNKRVLPHAAYDVPATLRVVMGPQDDYFTQKGIDTFIGGEYTVSQNSDRMGIRLTGKAIEPVNGVDIISDGIAYGSVQIPSNGQPIILGADRQTTGGYAKIATVISVDMPGAAQLKPGDRVNFEAISVNEAQKELVKYEKEMKSIDKRLNG